MAQPYTDIPLPGSQQGKDDVVRAESFILGEISRMSFPGILICRYDTVQKQVDKLGPSTPTKTWLQALVTELTNRGF
jgi:hypothetical protein